MAGAFQKRALRKAAEALGGEVALRRLLEVPSTELFRWLRGQAPVPEDVVRKVINLLAELEASGFSRTPPAESPDRRGSAARRS